MDLLVVMVTGNGPWPAVVVMLIVHTERLPDGELGYMLPSVIVHTERLSDGELGYMLPSVRARCMSLVMHKTRRAVELESRRFNFF